MATDWMVAAACGSAAAAAVVISAAHACALPKRQFARRERVRVVGSGVFAVALCLWPLFFLAVARAFGVGGGSSSMLSHPALCFAFLWPMALLLADVASAGRRTRRTLNEEQARAGDLKMNSNMLIGAAWAVGALLAVLRYTGAKATQSWSPSSARFVLLALLFCIAFIMPTPEEDVRAYGSVLTRTVQKAVLSYAVGLFVAGVVLAWVVVP